MVLGVRRPLVAVPGAVPPAHWAAVSLSRSPGGAVNSLGTNPRKSRGEEPSITCQCRAVGGRAGVLRNSPALITSLTGSAEKTGFCSGLRAGAQRPLMPRRERPGSRIDMGAALLE